MAVDLQAMKTLMEQAVPFVKKLGLEVKSVGDGKVHLELPWRDDNANHVGTSHAGAIFSLAETAGGALAASSFDMGKLMLVVRGAKINYRKPVRGLLTCTGSITPERVKEAMVAVERDGKVNVPIRLEMTNEKGELAAEVEVEYHLRKLNR